MTAERLRVGFLGGVRHALPYARILTRDPRVEVVGVADEPSSTQWIQKAGRALAGELGVEWTTEVDRFARSDTVDLVVVCSEPTRHADLACTAIEAGLHVCVDKPVATSLADANRVLDAATRSSRACAVVNRTFSPALRRLRSWVDDGHLGLPRHVDVEFLTSSATFALDVEDPRLVLDVALSGGGELRNFLGYAVDAIRFLTGLEVEEVYAESDSLFGGSHAEYSVEDAAIVSILLRNGVTATATIGRVPAVPTVGSTHSMIRVIGSHGHAAVSDEQPRVLRFGTGVVSAAPVDGGGGRIAVEAFFGDLVDRLLSGRSPEYTLADSLAGVAVTDAAYRSCRSGANVVVSTTA